ncbi:MAG: hypothetical protein ACRBFS_13245 [Aureispira sp.]
MMKRLHLLHIIALITLFCAGIYWIGAMEKIGRPTAIFPSDKGIPITRLAAFAAMVVFAFSAVIGWRVRGQRKILGTIWSLAGVGSVCWMMLMWLRPTPISLIEVFPFWFLYVMLGTVGSAYSISTWKEGRSFYNGHYEEGLLDDSLDEFKQR